MNTEQLAHFKSKLTEELEQTEVELTSLGWENPETGEWDATARDMDIASPLADANEAGDEIEELEEHGEEIDAIQTHWRNIKRALTNIEEGAYGICEICSNEIEKERLEVIPSARTCEADRDGEVDLLP